MPVFTLHERQHLYEVKGPSAKQLHALKLLFKDVGGSPNGHSEAGSTSYSTQVGMGSASFRNGLEKRGWIEVIRWSADMIDPESSATSKKLTLLVALTDEGDRLARQR